MLLVFSTIDIRILKEYSMKNVRALEVIVVGSCLITGTANYYDLYRNANVRLLGLGKPTHITVSLEHLK